MIIELPVSAFSKKIIQKFNTADPLVIRSNDPLFSYFGYIKTERPYNAGRAMQYLNDMLRVEISAKISRRSIPYLYQAGINIHKHHLQQMMIFTEAQTLIGGVATNALMQFLSLYDVTDDEMNFETALRQWQRWYSQRKLQLLSGNYVALTPEVWNQKRHHRTRLVPAQKIHTQISRLVFQNIDYFTSADREFQKKLLLHITIYYYHKNQMYGTRELAGMFGKSRRQIQRSIYNIKNIIHYDAMIGEKLRVLMS